MIWYKHWFFIIISLYFYTDWVENVGVWPLVLTPHWPLCLRHLLWCPSNIWVTERETGLASYFLCVYSCLWFIAAVSVPDMLTWRLTQLQSCQTRKTPSLEVVQNLDMTGTNTATVTPSSHLHQWICGGKVAITSNTSKSGSGFPEDGNRGRGRERERRGGRGVRCETENWLQFKRWKFCVQN